MTHKEIESLLEICKQMREASSRLNGPDVQVFSFDDVDEIRAGFERLARQYFRLENDYQAGIGPRDIG